MIVLQITIWLFVVFAACAAAHLAYLEGTLKGLNEALTIIGHPPAPRTWRDHATMVMLLLIVLVFSCPLLMVKS